LAQRSQVTLEPRKSPVQARSAASVDAILEATIQVLLTLGKERLTTTRVALRAGVSVGTLYQYFPNKSALLQAALKRHLDEVAQAVERVCREQKGNTLEHMATALITAFLEAKMKDAKTSVALYSVSSDVDGARIVQPAPACRSRKIRNSWLRCCRGRWPESAGNCSNPVRPKRNSTHSGMNSLSLHARTWTPLPCGPSV
jgi:AcrR family transcriptional regulator